jgi:hypothetical protein
MTIPRAYARKYSSLSVTTSVYPVNAVSGGSQESASVRDVFPRRF